MGYRSVMITGGSGYLGGKVLAILARLENRPDIIVSIDIKEPPHEKREEGVVYIVKDIRDPGVSGIVKKYGVEAVVHLAAIVTPAPGMTREFLYDVDVNGTRNVLEACLENDVKQIIVTSSGAAYGYHPDNPEWIAEDAPLRGNEEFAYSHHKRLVEEILSEYRKKYPQLKQLILRPGTILGKDTKNQITAIFERKFLVEIKGGDSRFVFIYDEDVAEIIVRGLMEKKEGIYNLAGSGALSMEEIGKILNKPVIKLSEGPVRLVLAFLKKFNLTRYGPEQVLFLKYRPVLSNKKLIDEFGYKPMSSKDVFMLFVKNRLSIQ